MKRASSYIITIAFLCLTVISGYPHSGRTDRNGGHHDRKNGGYHYHNSGTRRQTVRRQSVTPKQTATKRVWVRGYYRKDGTYVKGHYRTAPDGNPYNNYSFPGNYNPNTGKITPGNPQTYLDRYYNKSNTSPPPSTSGEYNSHDVLDTRAQQTTDDLQQIKTEEQQLSEQTQQGQIPVTTSPKVQPQYTYTPTGRDNSSDTSSTSAAIVFILAIGFVVYILRRR